MKLGRVIGTAVSTAKSERLAGRTLLVIQPITVANEVDGTPYVAIDYVGAGLSEVVLVTRGGAARVEQESNAPPVDAAVVAIVDRVDVDGSPTYKKS